MRASFAGGSCTTVLAHHVSLLLGMLKDQVLHHSFIKATATLETIAMAMDQVPDVMRNVGVGILSCDLHGYKLTIQMLKHMFTWQPKHVCNQDFTNSLCGCVAQPSEAAEY